MDNPCNHPLPNVDAICDFDKFCSSFNNQAPKIANLTTLRSNIIHFIVFLAHFSNQQFDWLIILRIVFKTRTSSQQEMGDLWCTSIIRIVPWCFLMSLKPIWLYFLQNINTISPTKKTYGPTINLRYPLRCNYDIPHQIRKRHAYIDPDRVGTTNQQRAHSTAIWLTVIF